MTTNFCHYSSIRYLNNDDINDRLRRLYKGMCFLQGASGTGVLTIVAGTGITVDSTDPQNPIVSASGSSGWGLTGNAGTTAGTNFLGTTNNVGLMFKVNNIESGYINVLRSNTSFGQSALINSIGNGNTAFGYFSMSGATNAANCTAIGLSALRVIAGAGNTGVGYQAGLNSTICQFNSAIGYQALLTNVLGTFNTAVGKGALYSTNGNGTTGSYNVGIGNDAGRYNTTGAQQIFINSLDRINYTGDQTESPIYIQQNATVASQLLRLNGMVGVNKSPTVALDVLGDVAVKGAPYNHNFFAIELGNGIGYLGDNSGDVNGNVIKIDDTNSLVYYDNTLHTGKFGINTSTPTVALDVVGQINVNAAGVGDNNIFSDGVSEFGESAGTRIRVRGSTTSDNIFYNAVNGHIMAGTVQMSTYGAGAATFDASGNITSVSDERLKTNIKPYKTGLKELLLIKPIQYNWNEKSKMETAGTYAGFSAQNVKANIPLGTGENKDGYLSLQDRALLATAYNAIQELAAKVDKLEKQNAELVKNQK